LLFYVRIKQRLVIEEIVSFCLGYYHATIIVVAMLQSRKDLSNVIKVIVHQILQSFNCCFNVTIKQRLVIEVIVSFCLGYYDATIIVVAMLQSSKDMSNVIKVIVHWLLQSFNCCFNVTIKQILVSEVNVFFLLWLLRCNHYCCCNVGIVVVMLQSSEDMSNVMNVLVHMLLQW
jgi:hypothetical protein